MNACAKPLVTIEAFESGAVDAEQFDHEAHIYVAWLYVTRYPVLDAIRRFSLALQRLTRKLGVPDKYHVTITWFYLLLIDERRGRSENRDWYAFRRANPDLFATGADSMMTRYYRSETLASERARRTFLLPDRLAA